MKFKFFAILILAAAWRPCGAAAEMPARRVATVKIAEFSSSSREYRMLEALDGGDFDAIDALLREGANIDGFLAFAEGVWPGRLCFGEVDTRELRLGEHVWLDTSSAAHGAKDLFWRAYPRAANAKHPHGYIRIYGTPLMAAARAGNVRAVAFLLSRGANANMFLKLGGGKWLYALREPFPGAVSARERRRADEIFDMLANAGAVAIEGDDLRRGVELAPAAKDAIERLRAEERAIAETALERQREQAEAYARIMRDAALARRGEEARAGMALEEIRRKDRALREEEGDRERAFVSGQTLPQFRAAGSLGLEKVSPGHGNLYRDGDGRAYRIDVDGTVYKFADDGSLLSVPNPQEGK